MQSDSVNKRRQKFFSIFFGTTFALYALIGFGFRVVPAIEKCETSNINSYLINGSGTMITTGIFVALSILFYFINSIGPVYYDKYKFGLLFSSILFFATNTVVGIFTLDGISKIVDYDDCSGIIKTTIAQVYIQLFATGLIFPVALIGFYL